MSFQPDYYPMSYVPEARPAPVDDRQLEQLAAVADAARQGLATVAESEWLLSAAAPLLRELQARRASMAHLPALAVVNVIQIGAR